MPCWHTIDIERQLKPSRKSKAGLARHIKVTAKGLSLVINQKAIIMNIVIERVFRNETHASTI